MYSKNNFLTTCKHRQAKFRRFLVICWFKQLFLFYAQFSSSSVIPNRIQYCSCTSSCLPFTKSFRFLSFQWKIPGSNWTSEKLDLFFRSNVPRGNSCFISQKLSLIPVSAELICANDKHDSTINITSPEFFLPFAQTVYRPVCSCKW